VKSGGRFEIPQVVIRTNTLLLILTREVRWQAEIPQVVIRTHTILLPWPVRSQVACGDALYGNPHTFQRQKCLQSLHAFKGDNDPHLHFKDKNVFNHCILSKATMNLICISKTIMSSVISCLQRRQCPHLHVEDDNVFTSKTSVSFFPVLCRTRRPLFVHFYKNGESKWKWKWIKREKKEFQYLHAFTGFTAWIYASGRSGKDSARTKLVSYLYFPFISNKR